MPTITKLPLYPGPRIARRTPAGWDDRPYTLFTVRPLGVTIGAEISDISLAEPLSPTVQAELNRALLEWKVLFFRDQHLTREQHAAFAANWGELEDHPFIRLHTSQPKAAEVVRLEKGPEAKGVENFWHSDVTWREAPSLGSVLQAIELPEYGGDTLFADMGAAYDCLPGEVKGLIDDMVAVHDWINTFGRGMKPEVREALRPDFPAVEHPVVRTHPETGRKTLYVNRAFTQHIVGLDGDESTRLLEYLYLQAMLPEFQVRFTWTPGALAFWDNRSTQHYAVSDYYPQRRVMERITIVGDRPY